MVRALAFLMLAAFSCTATIGCGSPGPAVIPEDAKEFDGNEMNQADNSATMTAEDK